MAEKSTPVRINEKAAAITGAVVGFLWGLASTVSSMFLRGGTRVYGTVGSGFNVSNTTGGYIMAHTYAGFGWFSILIGVVGGIIAGLIIAYVYNWAAHMK